MRRAGLRRLGSDLVQVGRRLSLDRHQHGGLGQADVVAGYDLLDVFGQVVPQVEPVRDLDRVRRSGASAV